MYILTQTHLVAQYIDDLLWKHPPDCFLPHGQDETFEKILIGIEEKKSEFFEYILNLTEQPLINQKCCIYELWDETHPSKRELSEKKLLQYQAKGFEISHTTSEAIVVNLVNT